MQAGLAEVAEIAATLKGAATQDARDVRRVEDLKSALFVLRAILTAGLARRESRGAFVRREFAIGDDPAWRRNSCLSYEAENDRLTVSHHAVETN